MKLIAKEFLWLIVTLVLAIPLSLLFIGAMDLVARGDSLTDTEKKMIVELFIIAYVINFIGIYVVRFIVMAVKKVAQEPAK